MLMEWLLPIAVFAVFLALYLLRSGDRRGWRTRKGVARGGSAAERGVRRMVRIVGLVAVLAVVVAISGGERAGYAAATVVASTLVLYGSALLSNWRGAADSYARAFDMGIGRGARALARTFGGAMVLIGAVGATGSIIAIVQS